MNRQCPWFLCPVMALLLALFVQCSSPAIRKADKELIFSGQISDPMRVLVISNYADSLFLRQASSALSKKEIKSKEVRYLTERMKTTLTHPDVDGVGLAAPQVGVGIQVIAVQRFDKVGEPIEFYFNPTIVQYSKMINAGREGCLSIPGYRGNVERSQEITVTYLDADGKEREELIEGFSAVIFQHEIDHLNGILYFDRIVNGLASLERVME